MLSILWIILAAVVVVGLACFVGARSHQQTSARGLGKGAGHAGSARYRNRGSREREDRADSA